MKWETPTFVEINMSAEIGGYQSDFDGQDPVAPAAARGDEAKNAPTCLRPGVNTFVVAARGADMLVSERRQGLRPHLRAGGAQ